MDQVIKVAAVEDNRILIDSLRAWFSEDLGIQLTAIASTVGELLEHQGERADVVLLNAELRAERDPAINARRLLDAGYRVLVLDGSAELRAEVRTLAAGVHGYLTRDDDLAALTATLREIASGGSPGPSPVVRSDGHPLRPWLSEREHAVLLAYASGQTLYSTARDLGITEETAKTYLKRVKAKYQLAGLPVYTKIDLAHEVSVGVCTRAARGTRPQNP